MIFIVGLILLGKRKLPKERTFAMIKPDASHKADEITQIMKDNSFTVVKQKRFKMSDELAKKFYSEYSEKTFFNDLITYMTSGEVVALWLEKDYHTVIDFLDLMGPIDPMSAKERAPTSLRTKFGTSLAKNAVHGSGSTEAAEREIKIIFSTI